MSSSAILLNGSFGCGLQVYWVGPYIGATIGSIVYQLSDRIGDHSERRRLQKDENAKLGRPGPYTYAPMLRDWTLGI